MKEPEPGYEHVPEWADDNARRRFDEDRANPSKFAVSYRGLRSRILPSWENGSFQEDCLEGYLDELPTLGGADFVSLVNAEIGKRREISLTTASQIESVVILDIGYGDGSFLLDCREEWGDKVRLVGLGASVYTRIERSRNTKDRVGEPVLFPPTEKQIKEKGIELIEGNAVDVRNILGDAFADFIVSAYALMYVDYPPYELLRKIYSILKPAGVALLDYSPTAYARVETILTKLKMAGYEIELNHDGVAFRKTHDQLDPSIRTVDWGTPDSRIRVDYHDLISNGS
jgi:SAM-dependent methyltransferase